MLKTTRHLAIACVLVLSAGVSAFPAQAQPDYARRGQYPGIAVMPQAYLPPERGALPQWAQRKLSASEAKSIALKRVPGAEVIDVALDGNIYRVRLIRRDGKVVDVYVDALTGKVR